MLEIKTSWGLQIQYTIDTDRLDDENNLIKFAEILKNNNYSVAYVISYTLFELNEKITNQVKLATYILRLVKTYCNLNPDKLDEKTLTSIIRNAKDIGINYSVGYDQLEVLPIEA